MKRFIACFMGLLLSTTHAQATTFINPSFETGNYSGWTFQDLNQPLMPMAVLPDGNTAQTWGG